MSKARILAVDDQRYFRELIEGLLQEEGYEVETVSTAVEALHLLDREVFDIVITDLVMPGVDGTELVGRIKERLPEQDIVMVTGVVDVKTAVEAMKQGATDYILKPFDRNTLADSLSKILQRRRLRDEHARLMTENLEYMGVLSLYERASALYSTLAVEPLAERLIEGLCLETHAQGGVVWIADDLESSRLTLKGVRGIIRVEEEAQELAANDLGGDLDALLEPGSPVLLPRPIDQESSALFVPLRFDGALIGLARLTDPLDGGEFSDRDRMAAEKFSSHGVTALVNALRYRALERRSFRDPTTLAYTQDFYQDAVRNEVQKAARFGHSFSMIHIDLGPLAALRRRASDGDFSRWILDLVEHLRSALRSADLLASRDESHYDVLLPETDAVGAAVLKQRIRGLIEQSEILSSVAPDLCGALALAAVTYPTDGTQLENLSRLIEARLERDQTSPLRTLSIGERKFSGAIDRLLEEGASERAELSVEATQLLLSEVERRPRDRGLLFLSPSAATLPAVRKGLERLRAQKTRTEIVLVGEELELGEEMGAVTCVPTDRAGTDRPFALYYGEGPVYAMVTAHRPDGDEIRFFHTDDRSLVEHLAFQFQKDLGLPIGAAT
jgi:FixJ family two-component response regulator/GGDEF domain-containing protein